MIRKRIDFKEEDLKILNKYLTKERKTIHSNVQLLQYQVKFIESLGEETFTEKGRSFILEMLKDLRDIIKFSSFGELFRFLINSYIQVMDEKFKPKNKKLLWKRLRDNWRWKY